MPVICWDLDVVFNDVPGTGGRYTAQVLSSAMGGKEIKPKHLSFRRMAVVDPPSIRVITMREPVDWYRAYWTRARRSTRARGAWPISIGGDRQYPTRVVDEVCGHGEFEQFVRNVLREFPEGFLRGLYCDYLNGATHVLRYEYLDDDLAALLRMRGIDPRTVALDFPATRESWWWKRAILPRGVERALREAERLDGLEIPYIAGCDRPRRRWRPVRTRHRLSRAETRHADHL